MLSKHKWAISGLALTALAGAAAWQQWHARQGLPEGLIQANGRLEAEHIGVASKTPGRIAKLLVREGDKVEAGQPLALLEDVQLKAKADQVAQTEAALQAQLAGAQATLDVTQREVPLGIAAAQAQVARADATLAKAKAAEVQARKDADRLRELFQRGSVERHKTELADLALTAASADVQAAATGRTQAEQALAQARLGNDKVKAKQIEIGALAAQVQQAQAAGREIGSVVSDLTLKAPAAGTVMSKIHDVGDVVAAGAPLLDLVNLDQLYLKVYVPENSIGKLKLGQQAMVYTDAFPDSGFAATLRHIGSRAEFTPKEVQTPDERVKLVYAVKLYLDSNPQQQLTPGIPADAVVRWKDGVAWQKPRW